jgi:ubiquitin thioesterase protein OTUB1
MSYHMKENAPLYEHWVQDGTIDTYRDTLQTVSAEMDELSLKAAYDLLCTPARVNIEVLYLDRSQGDTLTPHLYEPDVKTEPIATIRLLYRP